MFNLDDAIGQWRGNMACGGACSRSALDELESHVRDQVDQLLSANLSPEEALSVALHRIGTPDTLRLEYAKVNAAGLWQDRLFWMLVGFLGFWLSGAAASGMSALCALAGVALGMHGTALGVTQSGCWAVVFGCMVWFCVARRETIARWAGVYVIGRSRGRYAIVVALLLGVNLAGRFVASVLTPLIREWGGVGEYGRTAMARAYVDMGVYLMLPLAAAVAAAWLSRGRERQNVSMAG